MCGSCSAKGRGARSASNCWNATIRFFRITIAGISRRLDVSFRSSHSAAWCYQLCVKNQLIDNCWRSRDIDRRVWRNSRSIAQSRTSILII
jgi:hypothetical protein